MLAKHIIAMTNAVAGAAMRALLQGGGFGYRNEVAGKVARN